MSRGVLGALLLWVAVSAVAVSLRDVWASPPASHALRPAYIDPAILRRIASAPDADIDAIVRMTGPADPQREPGSGGDAGDVVRRLDRRERTSRQAVLPALLRAYVRGDMANFQPLWIVNGFSLTASPSLVRELAAHPAVISIAIDRTVTEPNLPPEVAAATTAELNIALIGAPALWDLGARGQGVVIASLDTGVDYSHPDLASRWRGGSNSWFDPSGQHAAPGDTSGHGTWTMGVAVGGSSGGSSIGVAPDAQWIAAKIFDDNGSATISRIHQSFQWALDPDSNPATADAPDIVTNSWAFTTPGCDLEFQADIDALRAAGIFPVFAAGNAGPGASTDLSPANNAGAFAVGATDNTDTMYARSSAGPPSCSGRTAAFPDVVAPGVAIRTADLYGGYYVASGTSLAAPHVSGAAALLLSAYPWLDVDQLEAALRGGAIDLGLPGPDDESGAGRIDLVASRALLAAIPTPTPTPTATASPTATATDTPPSTATASPSPAPLPGDVSCDGAVSMSDALLLARYIMGLQPALACESNGDVTGDAVLSMTDALAIARQVVGLP